MESNNLKTQQISDQTDAQVESESSPELRPEPARRIDPNAIPAWRISGGLASLFYWVFPLLLGSVYWGTPWQWPVLILAVFVVINSSLQASVIPYIRWRHWRYSIDEHEIDLKRGIFVITRTLIPIKRVQHVDTRQGPILRRFGLATVTVSTAATTHEIPALSEEVADEARNRISNFARLAKDDDV